MPCSSSLKIKSWKMITLSLASFTSNWGQRLASKTRLDRLGITRVHCNLPASTLAIANSVSRSRTARRRPATAEVMGFSKTSFGMTGAVFLVFPIVFFERATLLAINPRIPCTPRFAESLSRSGSLAKFCGGGAVANGTHIRPLRAAVGPADERNSR
jgi:hypothetical protein